jgi:Protein kinase domain
MLKPAAEQMTQRFEHCELIRGADGKPIELGRGAMGITYKAFDVDLHCPVTLKVISERYVGDESARLRFLREARAAASLRHPNVASVFHLGKNAGNYFYAMEFVDGETLEDLIKRSGRLDVKLALEIATQVVAGLAAVHEQKLVHRDIKPIADLMEALQVLIPGDAVAPLALTEKLQGRFRLLGPQGFTGIGMGAVDMPAWDLLARSAGLSPTRFLGGEETPQYPRPDRGDIQPSDLHGAPAEVRLVAEACRRQPRRLPPLKRNRIGNG